MLIGLSIASESDTEGHAFANIHLRSAFNTCRAFADFEKANLELNETDHIFAPGAIPILHKNIETTEMIKSLLVKADEQSIAFHDVLKILLTTRLTYLNQRKIIITTFRQLIAQSGGKITAGMPIYGPTNPESFDGLHPDFQVFARISTDRYQLLNQIILYVWNCVNPRTLPVDVKKLIRCSTTLWPNLTGERTYLGHPDEAILNYDGQSNRYEIDIILHANHFEEFDRPMIFMNWTRDRNTIKTTRYMRSLWDETFDGYGQILDLPYPDWLKSEIPQLTTPPSVDHISKPTPPSQAHEDGTKPQAQKGKQSKPPRDMPTKPSTQTISSLKLDASTATSPIKHKVLATDNVQDVQANKTVTVTDATQIHGTVPQVSSNNMTIPATPKRVETTPAAVQQAMTSISKYDGLKKKRRMLIDQIFDPQGFNTINYGMFKKLWIKLHGEKSVEESTGSSHKKLIARDGQVFPIFAHNNGMRYTKNTIAYLRDALKESGYSPFEK
jgi:hypothetical protein